MHYGDLSTAPEIVHSPSFLPISSVIPNLSPVVSFAPGSHKKYQARKLEIRFLSGVLGLLTLGAIVGSGMSHFLTTFWASIVTNDYVVVMGVFFSIGSILFLVRFPFVWYSGVVVEREFGLMRQSITGWMWDLLKGLLIGSLLGVFVVGGLYWCLKTFGALWWAPLGSLLFMMQIVLSLIGPRLLLPLFYKLSPLEDDALKERIERLCARTGILAKGIFVIGFGEKTKKANAALTGLGPAKRIVLSDTLLENLHDEEVEAVFAHEAGHLKLRHIWLGILTGVMSSFASLFIVSIAYGYLTSFLGGRPDDIAFLPLLGVLATLTSVVFGPIGLWLSRRHEFAADRFAAELIGDAEPLSNALEKLGRINLADPDPHPLLEMLTFSHPSLTRRLARLRANS